MPCGDRRKAAVMAAAGLGKERRIVRRYVRMGVERKVKGLVRRVRR